ncbi:M23 family metallopeptidase [Mahella sp.]|uniref:peptidoglycan DD-metalloendopeptidase family protein n=1 Tax=Mahella sp. TaxID=2798721 RepID=UPI0025C1647B|nr:M23 family metallopeptidase [Mahella sp.]MBZ4665652.1 Peptidase [Mahella sp.]MDK2902767.1 hypothetical protein [Clostridiales bacterium]
MRVWFKSGADFLISRNIWDKLRKKISDTYEQLKKYNQTLYIKYKKAIIVVKSKIIAIGKSLEAWRLQKPPYKKLISVGLLAALCYGSMFAYNKAEAYKIANTPIAAVEVLFKGESIGVVASEEPLQQAIEDMERQIEDYYKMDVVSVDDIVFSPTAVKPALIENNDAILNVIKDGMHFKVKATAILVNGQQIAVVKDESEAQTVLDRIKQPYIDKAKDNPNIKEVRIADDVQLVEKLVEYSDIENADDVYKRIKDGDEGKKVYEVKDGDTIWAIAKRYKLSLDDIQKANPDITSLDDLQIGDKINLTVPKEIINVETVERIEYTEDIPYETVYKEDGKLYKNQSKVLTEGSNGQREIVADVIKINGVEQKRTIISDNVVKNKRDQVIAKGTKPLPSIIGTGNIGLPARGRITSRFGYRGKEFHAGVDIAAPYGSPIHAADNGKVIFAGWNGNYGNLVKIDHGNGMVTYYAHASRIAVKVGQAVAKGQLIAYVGSTGRSTGPHVHFEVRKNGKPINPMR